MEEKIVSVKGSKIVRRCIKKYGTYTLENRAVADFRDGLKPVQRRLLWALYKMGATSNKGFFKAAKVVGDTMGNYHPHGDMSIFQALVAMVNARYPMVEGHGNWDANEPAAPRYVECRLEKLAKWLYDCSEVGQYAPNYDDTQKEPLVIPSRLPLFLMNGSEGIAVGVSCSIPPFNASELIEAIVATVKNKNIKTSDIAKIMKAPDYGTGVLLSSKSEVLSMYKDGVGSLRYGSVYEVQEKDGVHELVIKSFAPRFNVASFKAACQEWQDQKLIEYYYDGEGDSVIVAYKNSTILRNNILPKLETSIRYDFYVERRVSEDEIQVYHENLKGLLTKWVEYRREVETAQLTLEAKRLNDKIAREEALLIAIKNITVIADALKKDDTEGIIKRKLKLTDFQVQVIMDTTVKSLKRKNEKDIKSRIADLAKELKGVKYNIAHIDAFIIGLLGKIKEELGKDPRGTKLKTAEVEIKGQSSGGMYVITNDKSLRKLDRVTGAFKLTNLTKDGAGVTTVSDHGLVGHWGLMDVPDGDVDSLYTPIVGLIPFSKKKLVCLTSMSNLSVVENPQDRSDYKAVKLKDKEYVVKAVGVGKDDTLLCFSKTHVHLRKYEDLKIQRNNTMGHKAVPRVTKDVDMIVVRPNDVVVQDGAEIACKNIKPGKKFYVVGKEMYLNKRIKSRSQAVRFLKKGKKPETFIKVV